MREKNLDVLVDHVLGIMGCNYFPVLCPSLVAFGILNTVFGTTVQKGQ